MVYLGSGAPGTHRASISMGIGGTFSWAGRGSERGMKLATYFNLVQRLGMCGEKPPILIRLQGVHSVVCTLLNTLRTGDADLRFYITTVEDG